ncbi:MAG: hypothetical protein SOU50_08885 [Oscillospiraceae bacterium]|nr:hypothetical protein [Oscillospiraceae bacterium]
MKKIRVTAAILAAMALTACGEQEPDVQTAANADTSVINEAVSEAVSENTSDETTAAEETVTETQTEASAEADTSEDDTPADEDAPLAVYDNNMKTYCFNVEKDGSYTFKHSGNDDTPWNIYILDEEFTDGMRYLYSNYTPDGVTEFTADLKAGQYVYFICTENEWTSSEFSDTQAEVYLNTAE